MSRPDKDWIARLLDNAEHTTVRHRRRPAVLGPTTLTVLLALTGVFAELQLGAGRLANACYVAALVAGASCLPFSTASDCGSRDAPAVSNRLSRPTGLIRQTQPSAASWPTEKSGSMAARLGAPIVSRKGAEVRFCRPTTERALPAAGTRRLQPSRHRDWRSSGSSYRAL